MAEEDDELDAYEELMARAFRSRQPLRVLREACSSPATPPGLRQALANIDEDGVRITSLIVTRLRFERLINGSVSAGEWFIDDSASFVAAFKRYQDAVPPTASFPPQEAHDFEAWRAREGGEETPSSTA